MAKKKMGDMLGSWAFLIGFILAVIIGLGFGGGYVTMMTSVLIALGILVGLLNINSGESSKFLLSGAVLVIVSELGKDAIAGVPYVSGVLPALLILFVPATLIVAIKNVFSMARN